LYSNVIIKKIFSNNSFDNYIFLETMCCLWLFFTYYLFIKFARTTL